jgi:tRNA U34 5-methylaminomethyl-2-thiouridine-forming methyltransferase MnmC
VLNERRRRAVMLRLSWATIAETVSQCELGRTAVIRAMQAYEQSPEAVAKWVNEEYPKIAKAAKQECADSLGRQKRIFLVLDSLRVHHSKLFKQWLEENEDNIVVFYLPSYSPELNPDELLNGDLKLRVTKTAPARNKIALTHTAVGALRSIQKLPGRVEKYLGQKDVAYTA